MNLQNLTKKEIELIKTAFTYGVTLGQKGMTKTRALQELEAVLNPDPDELYDSAMESNTP